MLKHIWVTHAAAWLASKELAKQEKQPLGPKKFSIKQYTVKSQEVDWLGLLGVTKKSPEGQGMIL